MARSFIPRPEMASKIADMLSPDPLFGEISGLFLAAPRRTGKSTFLRRDLKPMLEERGQVVLYVDLWADRSVDPAELIRGCLTQALAHNAKPIARLKKKVGIDRVGALGFNLGFKDDIDPGFTSTEALALLIEATQSDVVLIVDEAQQALETEAGRNAMYALKAARDAINQTPGDHHLYLVMTGSHRDKLAALVYDQKAPFYGARVRDFPKLGPNYTKIMSEMINEKLAPNAHITPEAMEEAFENLGRRPETLNECLRDWILQDGHSEEVWKALVQQKSENMDAARRSSIEGLSEMQLALLKMIAAEGNEFAPYAEQTRELLKSTNKGRLPSKGTIQNAIAELREKQFIWRPGYGSYALENAEIRRILLDE
ncbi:hypothetical protein ACGYLO_17750 [Sulfitobacter sp. 1A13353]|uniref:hypothetical protein n=1 Tax=Sulfitobacter sp. 1A13353 TaxID=3368568 RepID=UPI003746B56E